MELADLNTEQRVMVGFLEWNGHTHEAAVAVVRADRINAALLGAHLTPTLERIAVELTNLLNTARAADS